MTIPNWGRITPCQGDMLMLAGHALRRYHMPRGTVETDEDRLEAMRQGRQNLRRLTGQDFGYDLARWHAHLLGNDEWGYRHPYAWRTVRPAIERALTDADRLRLVKVLEADVADSAPGAGRRPCCDSINPELETELIALMEEDRTIEAIKRLRAATSAPLGACKSWVDERLSRMGGIPRKWKGKPCPYCGKPLRTDQARQCFECGKDWHEQGATP